MSNTPELPEDIKKEINETSEAYANKRYKFSHYPNEWMAVNNAHHAGATAYAQYKVLYEQAKELLDKVLSYDDFGAHKIEPDLYKEIKQFLDQQPK